MTQKTYAIKTTYMATLEDWISEARYSTPEAAQGAIELRRAKMQEAGRGDNFLRVVVEM